MKNSVLQIIYLDFDGELTNYRGELLSLDNIVVNDAALTSERIRTITAALNEQYAPQNVLFVTERPAAGSFSTIFVGQTDAFAPYGSFSGIAETIDKNNLDKNDNAFVLLDASNSDTEIIRTIAHETDHLLGTLNHGGDGLAAYAATYYISSGTQRESLNVNAGDTYEVKYGASVHQGAVNGSYYAYGILSACGAVSNINIYDRGIMHVEGGGSADNTSVHYMGELYVSGHGVIRNTHLTAAGHIGIGNGGIAYDTTVDGSGLSVYSSGMASGITVNTSGGVDVSNQGTLSDVTVSSAGRLDVEYQGNANNVTLKTGGILNGFSFNSDRTFATVSPSIQLADNVQLEYNSMQVRAKVEQVTVHSGAVMIVNSQGSAVTCIVSSGGSMVLAGGTAGGTIVSSGSVIVSSGGTVRTTTVSAGHLIVSQGGFSFQTRLERGTQTVLDGGIADTTVIRSGGILHVFQGGTAISARVSSYGALYVSSGGTAKEAVVASSGKIYISSNGTAEKTTVSRYGSMTVGSGGSAVETQLWGSALLSKGAVASDTLITSGGSLYISSGAIHRGTLQISGNAGVQVYSGGIVDFSLAAVSPDSTFLINDLSKVSGSPTYTVSLAYGQSFGVYNLAQNASGFSASVTVFNPDAEIGTLTVNGEIFELNGITLALTENNGDLTLTIAQAQYISLYSSGIVVSSARTMSDVYLGSGMTDFMKVPEGGNAVRTTIAANGSMTIESGGSAQNTSVFSGGLLTGSYGCSISDTLVLKGGRFSLWGNASKTILSSGCSMQIFSGGTADSTTVYSYGVLCVSSGGTANATTVSGGSLYVSSGGTATATTVSGGILSLRGGTASDTTVVKGEFFVEDGTANATTVNGGILSVRGGTANSITVNNGQLAVAHPDYHSGKADTIRVGSDGYLCVYGGGTATNITASSGACLALTVAPDTFIQGTSAGSGFEIKDGRLSGYTVNNNGSITIGNGGTATATTVNASSFLLISSGGTAHSTTVNRDGLLMIAPAGTANVTTVNAGGELYLQKYPDGTNTGGTANSTTVNAGGLMTIDSYCTANSTTVNAGGELRVYGGTALNIVENGGYVSFSAGADVTFAPNSFSGLMLSMASATLHSGTTASSTTINSGGALSVFRGGTADAAAVNAGGELIVSSGGTAFNIVENGGYVGVDAGTNVTFAPNSFSGLTLSGTGDEAFSDRTATVHSGTTATSITVKTWGCLLVYSCGTANSAAVHSNGRLEVYSGGTVHSVTVHSNGTLSAFDGGTVTNIIASSGARLSFGVTSDTCIQGTSAGSGFEIKNGCVSNYTVKREAGLSIYNGGTAHATTVNSGGDFYVHEGGTAYSTTLNFSGDLYVGGTASATTVNSGGWLKLNSGSIHRGSLQLESGAYVSAAAGSIIDFTLSDRTETDDYLINDLSLISGAPAYTVTVAANQASGVYKLAQGAENFTGTIVLGDETATYGTLTVNGDLFTYNSVDYSLCLDKGNLTLVVKDMLPPELTVTGNATEWTNENVTLTAAANEGIIEYFDGTRWIIGTSVIATENGTYLFRAIDQAGNVTEKAVVVDKIDKTAPGLEITGNATEWTNKDVILTATASDERGAAIYFKSSGETEFTLYTESITVSENGNYIFYAVDSLGNKTVEQTIAVDKIDKTPPTLEITGNATEWTNKDVILTAAASDERGAAIYFKSSGEAEFTLYTESITVSENGNYIFYAVDSLGNKTVEQTIAVDKIDKVSPTLEITGNATEWTNKDVILTATASDGTIEFFNGAAWVKTDVVTAAENGTYKFRVTDRAGNVTEKDVVVDKIDKTAPGLEITGNATEWTNKDVILTATASDGTIEFFNGSAWVKTDVATVTENGTYQFRVTDHAGNVTEKSVVVDKIDKTPPALEITGNATEWTNKDVILTATASDGTIEFFNGAAWVETTVVTATDNGTFLFRVTDQAGNVTEKSVTVDKIDKTAPALEITGNATEWTNKDVVLTAAASDGTIEYFNGSAWITGDTFTAIENGTYLFRVTDRAGNVTEKAVEVDKIDKTPPASPIASADVTEMTNSSVTVTAEFSDDAVRKEYSYNSTKWFTYTSGITFTSVGTIYFRAADHLGNISEVTRFRVDNIDRSAPSVPKTFNVSAAKNSILLDWNDVRDTGKAGLCGYYVRYGQNEDLTGNGFFTAESCLELNDLAAGKWFYQVCSVDTAGNVSNWSACQSFEMMPPVPSDLQSSAEGLSWKGIDGCTNYTVEYSTDDFATVLSIETDTCAVDMFALPPGRFKWRVCAAGSSNWAYGEEILSAGQENAQVFASDEDGNMDIFFANVQGLWEKDFAAQHLGDGSWQGTREIYPLQGKNRISGIFGGSEDANILVLTDDSNGDALFADDIYTALGDQVRLSQINEIRGGLGNDIIDLTSSRFTCPADSMTISGGDGDDVIWASGTNNLLKGDAGNDRLTGGTGSDILAGGAGNDTLHGGGGDDIFTFGAEWGTDTVEQLAAGSVILWFETGSEDNWDAERFVYTDGTNSVTVTNCGSVTLRFGADASLPTDVFEGSTSEKIFENKSLLA